MNTDPNWWREPPEIPTNVWELIAKFKSAMKYVEQLETELETVNQKNRAMESKLNRYQRLLTLAEQVIEQNHYLPRDSYSSEIERV